MSSPHLTCVSTSKLLPVNVSVVSKAPTTAFVGDMVVSVGIARFTTNVTVVEVPPPGAGVVTPMAMLCVTVRLVLGIVARSWVVPRTVVVSGVSLMVIVLPVTKAVPVAVICVADAPAVTDEGLILVKVGRGLTIVR